MPDTTALPDHVARFLAGPGRFAALATVDPDGGPRQAVTWYTFEADGRITLNSLQGRRWPANLGRDGRVALAIIDPADGYRFVALTGAVEETIRDQVIARADIVAMARRYEPDDPDGGARFMEQDRVTFRIRITGLHDHLS